MEIIQDCLCNNLNPTNRDGKRYLTCYQVADQHCIKRPDNSPGKRLDHAFNWFVRTLAEFG